MKEWMKLTPEIAEKLTYKRLGEGKIEIPDYLRLENPPEVPNQAVQTIDWIAVNLENANTAPLSWFQEQMNKAIVEDDLAYFKQAKLMINQALKIEEIRMLEERIEDLQRQVNQLRPPGP